MELEIYTDHERALRRQNDVLSSLLKVLPIGVFMVEVPSGKPLVANQAALELLGRGILPDATQENISAVYKAFKQNTNSPYPVDEMPIIRGMGGEVTHVDDMVVERSNGTRVLLEVFGAPVLDEQGAIWASLASFIDITERKKTEENLGIHQIELEMQNEELRVAHQELDNARLRYFDLYNLAPVGYCSINEQGLILEHNLTATMLLGEEKKGLDRKPITRFIVKEDQDIFYLHRKKIIDTGSIQSCELRMLVGGASEIWVRIQSTLAQANSGIPIFHLVLSDITERKNAEFERIYALDALKQSEARYLAIIEEQAELVCRYLPDGRLSFVNEAYVRYFGKKREEIMNCNYIPNIPAFDLPLIQENLGAITKDSPLAKFEHRVIMPDGKVRWQHWLHRGIYSPEGVLVEYQAVGRDVTDSIESAQEREHLLAELARKNEELERFTYTVSHDLKAPLHTIQGFAQEIQESIAENDYSHVSDYLSRIQNGARRMGEMLQDLIKLARLGHVANAFGPISLNNTLAEVQDAVAGLLSTHHVALDVSPSLPTIQGCSIRLHELFQNLIENAIKFRLRDGSARIEVGVEESPTKWSVFVKDNGIGVAPAHQKTIFGLFQKLNPKSEGSGIGLSLVSRIAQMHKAQVNIESAGEGRGCTFWLHFPKEIVL